LIDTPRHTLLDLNSPPGDFIRYDFTLVLVGKLCLSTKA